MEEGKGPPTPQGFPIVGIGASAGGLEALERLFTGLPSDTGMAFVVVQHLSPDFRSMMDELLARYTDMPVRQAKHEMELRPDHVYLMPPRTELVVQEGRLLLAEAPEGRGLFLPIDQFLKSLAGEVGERAVAVILSGTGSDGSRGVRAVHEQGGLVLVQSEESAKFDGMPRSAIDTGVADLVLPPQGLREALAGFARQPAHRGKQLSPTVLRDASDRIFKVLQAETGVDFSSYKPATVTRRIDRRLLLTRTGDLDAYVAKLEADPEEVRALYRDLLIGVTAFFRDAAAFEVLRTSVMPELVRRLGDGDELRLWSAACATGEEAYSLAILACEAVREAGVDATVKVLATDVHRTSLDVASAGVYPYSCVADLPLTLRERYFSVRGDQVQVSSDLRGCVVFAHHNLLRDAPFTRLDLVSCRNLLIYLRPEAQKKALALLYFGLRTDGVLFLGPSESPGGVLEAFDTVERRWKIYRKRGGQSLPSELRPADALLSVRPRTAAVTRADRGLSSVRDLLVERFAPATLLLGEDLRLVHTFNGAGRYLVQRDGAPSLNLADLVEGELRYAITGAARRCLKEDRPVVYDGVIVETRDGEERLRVGCEAVLAEGRRMLLCTLAPTRRSEVTERGDEVPDLDQMARERIEELEAELRINRENLQATAEEMEASNEELQATNEELIASNEELQSTNEELQSVNEELYSVNAEYQTKISELTELTNDMDHLLQSTEVHVIFLDRNLRIRKFTPKIAETFNLMPQDVGRRIDSFAHGLDHEDLLPDLRRVLDTGSMVEHGVQDRHGHHFLLRILPYRPHDRVQGVVLTLIDVTSLKRAEAELRHSESRHRTLIRAVASVVWVMDANGRFATRQEEWESYTGQSAPEYRGDGWIEAIHPEDRADVRSGWAEAVQQRAPFRADGRLWSRQHEGWRHFMVRAAPVFTEGGEVLEWVGNLVDVEENWQAARRFEEQERQLRAILDSSPNLIFVQGLDGRVQIASRSVLRLLGREEDEVVGRRPQDVFPTRLAASLEKRLASVREHPRPVTYEERVVRGDVERTYLLTSFPLLDTRGAPRAVGTVGEDITDRKRSEEKDREALRQRDRFIAMMSHELRNPLGVIVNATYAVDGGLDEGERARTWRMVQGQALHMARLLDDLLDVARIERGTLELRRKRVDVVQICRQVAEAMGHDFESKGVELRVQMPEHPLVVDGDRDRILQACSNVLRNALKFTERGHVELRMSKVDGQAVVEVADTGIGMSEEELEHLYDTFFQRDDDLARTSGGLGIGLTLTRSLLALHGGTICAESAGKGRGARFVLTLPLLDHQAQEAEPEGPTPELRPSTVVIVEDNPDSRTMMRMLLELRGVTVVEAGDGRAGVSAIREHRPGLALVDIGLPEMTGYEVARSVRSDDGCRAVKLVALTGYGRPEDRKKAFDSGFDEHLVKPVRPEDLERLAVSVAVPES